MARPIKGELDSDQWKKLGAHSGNLKFEIWNSGNLEFEIWNSGNLKFGIWNPLVQVDDYYKGFQMTGYFVANDSKIQMHHR